MIKLGLHFQSLLHMKRREKYKFFLNRQKLIGLFIVIVAVFSSGCQSVNYYTQAAAGQAELMWNSRPIVGS